MRYGCSKTASGGIIKSFEIVNHVQRGEGGISVLIKVLHFVNMIVFRKPCSV